MKIDEEHFKKTKRGKKIINYKSKLKKKKINKSNYDDNSRQTGLKTQ